MSVTIVCQQQLMQKDYPIVTKELREDKIILHHLERDVTLRVYKRRRRHRIYRIYFYNAFSIVIDGRRDKFVVEEEAITGGCKRAQKFLRIRRYKKRVFDT